MSVAFFAPLKRFFVISSLLPPLYIVFHPYTLGVSKKHKVHVKGQKVKREDNEEDAAIMQEKMSAMASLQGTLSVARDAQGHAKAQWQRCK